MKAADSWWFAKSRKWKKRSDRR